MELTCGPFAFPNQLGNAGSCRVCTCREKHASRAAASLTTLNTPSPTQTHTAKMHVPAYQDRQRRMQAAAAYSSARCSACSCATRRWPACACRILGTTKSQMRKVDPGGTQGKGEEWTLKKKNEKNEETVSGLLTA
eukprot:1159397-Pelagomonas_calceolata.AAC.4